METIDDITAQYEDNGQITTKEIDKAILSRGAWTTIAFLYQDLDRKSGEYGPLKVSVRRYKKFNGAYRQQSKFNISSMKQAEQLIDVLSGWIKTHGSDTAGTDDE
ncbi:MAG: hypothetical protein HUU55_09765 [Myxococcales bacterium]|nr:hypothetical protein [Myxococcales bacterium]